jgi:hypothetical protein
MSSRTSSARRFVSGSLIALCGAALAAGAFQANVFGSPKGGSGAHKGEKKQLDVDISFFGESGWTVTNADGTEYHRYSGSVKYEDKVYPSEYWGTFPLYFFGYQTGITVTVTNNGPRKVAKLRITTEAYQLRTDGSSGHALREPTSIDIELARGETRTIDASFVVNQTPESESGLDRFIVKVSHPNEGGGNGNTEPGLIMVQEGVFCPPLDDEESPPEVF